MTRTSPLIGVTGAHEGHERPAPTEWGSSRFRVRDPEGYEWTFGTHRPGLEQPT